MQHFESLRSVPKFVDAMYLLNHSGLHEPQDVHGCLLRKNLAQVVYHADAATIYHVNTHLDPVDVDGVGQKAKGKTNAKQACDATSDALPMLIHKYASSHFQGIFAGDKLKGKMFSCAVSPDSLHSVDSFASIIKPQLALLPPLLSEISESDKAELALLSSEPAIESHLNFATEALDIATRDGKDHASSFAYFFSPRRTICV